MDKLIDTSNILSSILRLRQITGGLFTEDYENAKLLRVTEMLEEEIIPAGGKVLILSNWSQVTETYRDALTDYVPAYITGDIKAKARQDEVDRFQNDPNCQLLIGTIGAMGTGLTLNKATHVIFLDKAWTAADNRQAEDRAHRIGTASSVNIISMVANGYV